MIRCDFKQASCSPTARSSSAGSCTGLPAGTGWPASTGPAAPTTTAPRSRCTEAASRASASSTNPSRDALPRIRLTWILTGPDQATWRNEFTFDGETWGLIEEYEMTAEVKERHGGRRGGPGRHGEAYAAVVRPVVLGWGATGGRPNAIHCPATTPSSPERELRDDPRHDGRRATGGRLAVARADGPGPGRLLHPQLGRAAAVPTTPNLAGDARARPVACRQAHATRTDRGRRSMFTRRAAA